MYYPIIDKLKELMSDITAVKDKEPLIIEGTPTSATEGTWTGSYSDITSAFSNNRQVLFKLILPSDTILIPIIVYNSGFSPSVCFPFYVGENIMVAYGTIVPDNTYKLHIVN